MTLELRVDGPADGAPLVLIAGLSLDLTSWPTELVEHLVARGHRVVRLDNRDSGASPQWTAHGTPSLLHVLRGAAPEGSYDLTDMAEDVVDVLDHLGIERAHLVGMSLGGMIAQTLAARHPGRVLSLTSIMSTTGDPEVGQPHWSTKLRILLMLARPAGSAERFARTHVRMTRHIGSPAYPLDEQTELAWAHALWQRGAGAAAINGVRRQIAAIAGSGDRTAQLAGITAPTLVIHGDRDLMVHPSGGRATAAAIPGAAYVEVEGMGHHLSASLAPLLAGLVADHAARGSEVGR